MILFFKKICLFLIPIIIIAGFLELLIRNIPNDYSYKKKYLDKNAANIEVLFLGSSHTYRGINPVYINGRSFNASYVSQTLDYDYKILEKYEGDWTNLKFIVVEVSYFSLFQKLESGPEPWRVKNYTIYYSLGNTCCITSHSELLSNRLNINVQRLQSYYLARQTNITSSELGWGKRDTLKSNLDIIKTGETAAQRHTAINDLFLHENIAILKSIITFASKHNAMVVLYTPPAFKTYTSHLNENQLSRTISTLIDIDNNYPNVLYINYLNSSLFTQNDFYDADHLNELGAKKLTLEIDKLINAQK